MNFEVRSNNVVVVARNHNPTILSDSFLLKAGMVDSHEEIDREKSVFLPMTSNIMFTDGSKITLDLNRLLAGYPGNRPAYTRGAQYCAALPHILGVAVGFNFDIKTDVPAFDWFEKYRLDKDTECSSISFKQGIMRVVINRLSDFIQIAFNFNYDLHGETLGEIPFSFEEEWTLSYERTQAFVKNLFNI